MFTPSQPLLKWLAAGFGAVSLLFAVPVTVMAEEFSVSQVLLAQQLPPELETAKQQLFQAFEEIEAENWEAAITLLEQALPVHQKVFGSEPSFIEFLLEGAKLAQAGQIEGAEAVFEWARMLLVLNQAMEQAEQDIDEIETAKHQAIQAIEEIDAGNWEAAVTLLEQALPVTRKFFDSEDSFIKFLEQLLRAAKLGQAGQTEEAKAAVMQAVELMKEAREATENDNKTTSPNDNQTTPSQSIVPEALPEVQTAIPSQSLLPETLPEVQIAVQQLGQASKQANAGNWEEAIILLEQVLPVFQTKLGAEHPAAKASEQLLRGAKLRQAGQTEEAEAAIKQGINFLNEAREQAEKTRGELEIVNQQVTQAIEQINAGNWEAAITLLEQILPVTRELFDSEGSFIKGLEQLLRGAKLAQTGYIVQARAAFEQADHLFKPAQETPTDSNQTASSSQLSPEVGRAEQQAIPSIPQFSRLEEPEQLYQQAEELYQQGKYREAISLAERVLEIRERTLAADHPNVANSLNFLATLYYEQGRFNQAEPLYQRALAIRENALAADHPGVALSLNNLANLYNSQGRYSQAEPLLQRALAISENTQGENHPDVATSLNNLAELYKAQGRYNQAESLHLRALAISENVQGENHPSVAVSLNNLALLYHSQGRYDQAEPLLQRALDIYQNTQGENHPSVAVSLNNLALLYHIQGRYSQAIPLYQRALAIDEKVLGENHPRVAISLNNLAAIYDALGRSSLAESLFLRSLAILENTLGENHPRVATNLNNLAHLYIYQERYSQAEPLLQRSLAILEKVLGKNHPHIAQNLNSLGGLYDTQGRYSQAEPLYLRSLTIRENTLGENHPYIANSLSNLAELYQATGDMTQATRFLSRGLEIQEQNLNILLATGSERQKQKSMQTLLRTTYQAISLHLQDAPNNSEAANLALTTILRRKARILDTVTNELQLIRANITPENQQLLDELNAIQQKRASLLYNSPQNLSPEQYRQRTNRLRAQAEQLEAQLAQRSAEFRVETEPVTIEKLQQLIPQDGALVEIMQYLPYDPKANNYGKPRYAAYIISANSIKWVDLGEAEPIDQKVNEFRRDLGEKRTNIENSARELDEIVMQPIREKLGDKTHVLISPDGQLNLIPFAALMDENNEYLVKNYLFTYLTTGRDLLKLQLDAPSRQDPVMLANPNYEEPGNSTGVQLASTSPTKTGRGINQRSTDFTNLSFSPLEGTELEAEAILPIVPNLQLFTGSEATENLLEQLQAPRILHIATHGFFLEDIDCIPTTGSRGTRSTVEFIPDPDFQPDCKPTPSNLENPLLRSGLALAGANPRQSEEKDGILTASEVTRLRLYGTKLVVLSACETGVGSVANGEGVYGLRRAFVKSGAESQLMSLWKVDDYGTSELMSMYYQRIKKGEGRSQAMRQVQLELLTAPAYQHPFYWSSFIFSGDWRPME